MFIIDIRFSLNNIEEKFKRSNFQIAQEIGKNLKLFGELMLKYMHPKFNNYFIFKKHLYVGNKHLQYGLFIIYDDKTSRLFYKNNTQTEFINPVHQLFERTPQQDVSLFDIEQIFKKIETSRKLKGIEFNERKSIDMLKNYFHIDDFKHKWLCDLEFVWHKTKYNFTKHQRLYVFELSKDKISLMTTNIREVIESWKFKSISIYGSNNTNILNKLPLIIRRGDSISKIVLCKEVILIEKETNVTWLVWDFQTNK